MCRGGSNDDEAMPDSKRQCVLAQEAKPKEYEDLTIDWCERYSTDEDRTSLQSPPSLSLFTKVVKLLQVCSCERWTARRLHEALKEFLESHEQWKKLGKHKKHSKN